MDGFNRLGLPCFEPRGAFYAFPSVESTGLSDEEFSERLLMEEKVAVVPGSAFGRSGQGHVRASYATSLPNIEEALKRVRALPGQALARTKHQVLGTCHGRPSASDSSASLGLTFSSNCLRVSSISTMASAARTASCFLTSDLIVAMWSNVRD